MEDNMIEINEATREQLEARLAELNAQPAEPDLSEAVKAFEHIYHERLGTAANALIAAYPALHKALGPRVPEPTEAEDLAMAQEVYRLYGYLDHFTEVIVAAFKAERKRAGGGK
jgi:hypothetical protein